MKKETYEYTGWLNSDNFIKRVVAVTLYQMLGSFVLSAIMITVFIVPVIIIAGVYKFNFTDDDIYYSEDETEVFENFDSEGIYFDEETRQWMDDYGVCHTCTPENGFSSDGVETEEGEYSQGDNQEKDNLSSIIVDDNGNTITEGCKEWFDGCNICQVGAPGAPMACTRKMCMPETMETTKCLDEK
jgi:hypothetical protein